MERKFNKQQKLHIKTGDTVMVIAGNAKGQTGVIKKVLVEKSRAVVEGLNMVTKHVKPSAANPQGGIIKTEGSIHISNIAILENGNQFVQDVSLTKTVNYNVFLKHQVNQQIV